MNGIEFEDYTKRINSIGEIETFGRLPKEKHKQNRFTIKNIEMPLKEIEKSKFAQISDKRYYFSDGIVSLSFSHLFLKEIIHFKREKSKKLRRFYNRKNTNLFRWKNLQLEKTKEFRFLEVSFSKNGHFIILIH